MVTEEWKPNAKPAKGSAIDKNVLKTLLEKLRGQSADSVEGLFSKEEQEKYVYLIKLGHQQWDSALKNYNSEDILSLIRFFTLAEMQLNGWQAGSDSSVIGLAKILRQRGEPLEKKWLLWIKQNSSNKFLPNGAL